jgi:hypothetical protein
MSEHNCVFIIGFHMEDGEDGDPIFCDAPAGMQIDGYWYCADHWDEVDEYQRTQAKTVIVSTHDSPMRPEDFYSLQIGVDIGLSKDETFVALYGIKDETVWQLGASKITKQEF